VPLDASLNVTFVVAGLFDRVNLLFADEGVCTGTGHVRVLSEVFSYHCKYLLYLCPILDGCRRRKVVDVCMNSQC